MAKDSKRTLRNGGVSRFLADPLAPPELTKQAFGAKLQELMWAREWNQSDLARNANIGRDSVSKYIRGISLPDPKNLRRLAKALDIADDELMPEGRVGAVESAVPSILIKGAPDDPSRVLLQINGIYSTEAAMEVMAILNKDEKARQGHDEAVNS